MPSRNYNMTFFIFKTCPPFLKSASSSKPSTSSSSAKAVANLADLVYFVPLVYFGFYNAKPEKPNDPFKLGMQIAHFKSP